MIQWLDPVDETTAQPAILLRALLASIIVHGLLLLGASRYVERPDSVASRPLRAEMRPPVRPEPAAIASAPTSVLQREVAPQRPQQRPIQTRQQTAVLPPSFHEPADSTATTQQPVVAGSPAANAVTRQHEEPNVAAAVANNGFDPEDLRRYKVDIAREARRFKRYPVLARERGWAGISEVAVSLGPHSSTPVVTLEKTSGFPLLDEQALAMIRQASRTASIPLGLQQMGIRVVLPVHFDLDE